MNETNNIAWNRLFIEAAAIVGSILLAFAIDAWWEGRNEVEQERRLLAALLVEFEQNGELLRQARAQYEHSYMDSLRILDYLQDGAASIGYAEFEKPFRGLLKAGTIHLKSGAHDGLLGSGDLSLIRDENLRNRLAAWPSYLKEWSEEQDAVFLYVHSELVPFLSASVRLRNIIGLAPFPDGEAPPPVPAGVSDPASVIDVSTTVEFENLVFRRAQGLWYAMRDGETLMAQATAIEELIRRNLEK
jgi:hypothetical protein